MLALFRLESRYALLGRHNFVDSILANHCVLPPHAHHNSADYGHGFIEYSSPAGSGGSGGPASQNIWSDGNYVYIGGLRLPIMKP